MKLSTLIAAQRKRPRRSASPFFKPRLERLEDRVVLASILPVSIAHPDGSSPVTGNGASQQASMSADGRYVAFVSDATNLVEGQIDTTVGGDHLKDVFLFDSFTNTTTLVSHRIGVPLETADGWSDFPVISADGKYIAYASRATNLDFGQNESAANGNEGLLDLFLYDVEANHSVLISHNSLSLPTPANGDVLEQRPAISADGRYVAFASTASNMVDGVTDGGGPDLFLFDLQSPKKIRLITRSASFPDFAVDSGVQAITLSADGQFVAFESFSSDLVPNQSDGNFHADIFLYDVTQDSLQLVTGAGGSDTLTGDGPSFQAADMAISAHGRYLAFRSFATNLVVGQNDTNNNADVFLFDRLAATNGERLRLISHAHDDSLAAASGSSAESEIPVINVDLDNYENSGDGLFVAYQSTAQNLVAGVNDGGDARDLFLYDVAADSSVLVTHATKLKPSDPITPATTLVSFAVENQSGITPVISRSGRYVAYSSPATDLVANQVDSMQTVTNDVFRFDRLTGDNTLLSGTGGSATQTGDSESHVNAISADGSTVAFSSLSTNLLAGDNKDNNLVQDVFVSAGEFTLTYTGRQFDLLSDSMRNAQDLINDAMFTLTRRQGLSDVDITDFELRRGDGTVWRSSPGAGESVLGATDSTQVANVIQGVNLINAALSGLKGTASVVGGETALLFAADAAPTRFAVGERFTLTAHLSDGSVVTAESEPIPDSFIKLAYNGKLRDRVGRGDASLTPDGQKDGTFTVTFPFGTGKLKGLELDRGDGNHWNTVPADSVWVLGVAQSLDFQLINETDGSLAPQESLLGGEFVLFAPEDRPEAESFFTEGKSFRVIAKFEDGSQQEASVTLSSFNVPPPQPDLAVGVANLPNTISPTEKSVYTVSVHNLGDGAATNVQLRSDSLPSGVQFVAAESPANCEQLSSRVVCTLDTLDAGADKSVALPFVFNDAGNVRLGFEASATETDANPLDNTASKVTNVLAPLQITLTDSPDPVHVGEELTYEIRITNPNDVPAADVFVSSPVPADSTFVRVSTTLCRFESDFFQCNLDQLDPGQSLPLRFVVHPTKAGTLENLGALVAQGGVPVASAPAVQTIVRPANDDFAKRQLLSGPTGNHVPGSNINATGESLVIRGPSEMEPVDPLHVTKSVWYEWRPTYASGNFGHVEFSTERSNFDTLLTVYARLLEGSLKVLTRNDDNPAAGDNTSRVSFTARGGVKYFIAVDGYHGAQGEIALSWTQGQEKQAATETPIVESLTPNQVKAGVDEQTEPELLLIAVRGAGFTAQSVVLVNGEERVTSPPFLDGNSQVLVVQLRGADTAFENGGLEISVRTGDKFSPVDAKSTLAIGEFATTTVLAGETGTTQTRSLLDVGKPQPYTELITQCDAASTNCFTTLAVYRNASSMFCDREGVCFPTLRQYQIAHGFFCDDSFCDRSLEAYRANHNGQNPTDPAMPGAVVANSLTTVGLTGVVDRSVVTLHSPAPMPDFPMLIAKNRASVLANDSASLVALGLIGQDLAGVVANDGAGVVANDGAGLVGENGAGEGPPVTQPAEWFVLRDNNGNPATITNTLNTDGTTTGMASVEMDDATLAMLQGGLILAVVVPDKLEFDSASYSVAENGGEALISVMRTGTSVGRVTVMYATEDDTATAGSDYTATSGMLTFESGEMSKTFSVPITKDTTPEALEKIKLMLSMPGGIVRLGDQSVAELSITPPEFPWRNSRDPLDTNNDNAVSPLDVLIIINELNSPTVILAGGVLPAPPAAGITFYYDVSGDDVLSPIDALQIINFLNTGERPASEGTIQLAIANTYRSQSLTHRDWPSSTVPCRSLGGGELSRPFIVLTQADPRLQMSSSDEARDTASRDAVFARWNGTNTSRHEEFNFALPRDQRQDALPRRTSLERTRNAAERDELLTSDEGDVSIVNDLLSL